jgi:hypothetical protein
MNGFVLNEELDTWLAFLGPEDTSQDGSEYMMSGALQDEEELSDPSTAHNAEIPYAAQSTGPVATGSGTNAPATHPAPPQQPAPVTVPAATTSRRVRFPRSRPPTATTAPPPAVIGDGIPAVPVEAQTMDPFAFSPDGMARPQVRLPTARVGYHYADPFTVSPEATVQLQAHLPNGEPFTQASHLTSQPPRDQDAGSEEDLYGVSDGGDGSDNGVTRNNGSQSTGLQNSGNPNNGNTAEAPRPASPTRLQRRLRLRQERLGRHGRPPAKAKRWDLAEMAQRRDTETMLKFILRAVGDDMASHVAYRSVLAAWWQLSAYPTHTATLRRGETWVSGPGRTESIIRDTVDDLFKRRNAMRLAVQADPLDTKNWVDLNAWFRLEGPYRMSTDIDDFEDSLPDSRGPEFNGVFPKAKDVASSYIHEVRRYYDEVEEMDWTAGGDEPEPEPEPQPEEDEEEDNNGLSELNIVEPRKPKTLYETAFAAGFGPEMRRGMIGLDLADIMRWKPQDQEKGFWKK